jgi:hypothetical protein
MFSFEGVIQTHQPAGAGAGLIHCAVSTEILKMICFLRELGKPRLDIKKWLKRSKPGARNFLEAVLLGEAVTSEFMG